MVVAVSLGAWLLEIADAFSAPQLRHCDAWQPQSAPACSHFRFGYGTRIAEGTRGVAFDRDPALRQVHLLQQQAEQFSLTESDRGG